jgi:PAS domain S-box
MRKDLITVSAESRRVLFETSALPMWIHDPVGGRFLAANDAMVSSYGWSREEVLNLPLDAIVATPADRRGIGKSISRSTPRRVRFRASRSFSHAR